MEERIMGMAHRILDAVETCDFKAMVEEARIALGPAEVVKYRIAQNLELNEEDHKYILNNLQ